jgi:formylglycine-generating enzyme required for sulfatase activity
VLALALAVAASYAGVRLQAHLANVRLLTAHVETAREEFGAGRELAQQAHVRREEALPLFDGRPSASVSPETSLGRWGLRTVAERKWTESLALREQAQAAYARASEVLEKALDRDRDHEETRELLAEVTYERVLLAERFHQRRERDEWAQRLEKLTATAEVGVEWRQRLLAPARLMLETEPPGAVVEIERYTDAQESRERTYMGQTPAHFTLREGSFLLHVTHPGRVPVKLPVLLTHGAREYVRVELPTAVPEGHVYIPPGCFLLGSAEPEDVRIFMLSPPLHRFCLTEGYLIGRHEVTFGDWMEYLDALPANAPARRILEEPRFGVAGAAVTLRKHPGAGWTFSFHPADDVVFTAREGEPFHYPGRRKRSTVDWRRFPLSGVSAEDLAGYFYWLDRTGRLPGARLCTQHEWEYAARGADGRRYSHGAQLQPDDANIDTTYERQLMARGPDMVGSYPASASPFGLEDTAGNAFEITRAVTPEFERIVLRGGAWYYDSFGAHLANLSAGDPTQRDAVIGVRVCASFSPR